jgi:hypothetical protein
MMNPQHQSDFSDRFTATGGRYWYWFSFTTPDFRAR